MPESRSQSYARRHKAKGQCISCPRKVGSHGTQRCRRCRKLHNDHQNAANQRRAAATGSDGVGGGTA